MKHLSIIIPTLVLMASAPALAQEEEESENVATSLEKQPAVRHRLLLVKGRFELTPAFETNVNAEYKYTLSGGLRAEYHLSDMLSFGAVGFFGTSVNTGLTNRIVDSLPESAADKEPDEELTPIRDEYTQHLNDMPLHGAAYVSVTPWYGKLAAFGKAFVNFDFYFSAGLAFAQLSNDCSPSVCSDDAPGEEEVEMENPDDPDNPIIITVPENYASDDPALNDGTRFGLYLGGGIHVFLTNWLALDLTVRNYLFSNNPSGLDTNFDFRVGDDDNRLLNHLFLGVGASVFLPMTPDRTP